MFKQWLLYIKIGTINKCNEWIKTIIWKKIQTSDE